MKKNKLYFLSFLFLFALAVSGYGQSVRYVAYFPVPYVSHNIITADTAYFAGKDDAVIDVLGAFSTNGISTDKDLVVDTLADNLKTVANLNVGAGSAENDGNFVVHRVDSSLSFDNIPTPAVTNGVNADTMKADMELLVNEINWSNNSGGKFRGFVKDTSVSMSGASANGYPNDAKTLCWKALRLKGSYEYQYYLIAIPSGTICANYTGS